MTIGAASVVVVDVVDVVDDVVVLINCFLSAEDETDAEADCCTDEDENEAETDELLDIVWLLVNSPAGREAAKLARKQQTNAAANANRLLLDAIFFFLVSKSI